MLSHARMVTEIIVGRIGQNQPKVFATLDGIIIRILGI